MKQGKRMMKAANLANHSIKNVVSNINTSESAIKDLEKSAESIKKVISECQGCENKYKTLAEDDTIHHLLVPGYENKASNAKVKKKGYIRDLESLKVAITEHKNFLEIQYVLFNLHAKEKKSSVRIENLRLEHDKKIEKGREEVKKVDDEFKKAILHNDSKAKHDERMAIKARNEMPYFIGKVVPDAEVQKHLETLNKKNGGELKKCSLVDDEASDGDEEDKTTKSGVDEGEYTREDVEFYDETPYEEGDESQRECDRERNGKNASKEKLITTILEKLPDYHNYDIMLLVSYYSKRTNGVDEAFLFLEEEKAAYQIEAPFSVSFGILEEEDSDDEVVKDHTVAKTTISKRTVYQKEQVNTTTRHKKIKRPLDDIVDPKETTQSSDQSDTESQPKPVKQKTKKKKPNFWSKGGSGVLKNGASAAGTGHTSTLCHVFVCNNPHNASPQVCSQQGGSDRKPPPPSPVR
jgi:hypothetical protein